MHEEGRKGAHKCASVNQGNASTAMFPHISSVQTCTLMPGYAHKDASNQTRTHLHPDTYTESARDKSASGDGRAGGRTCRIRPAPSRRTGSRNNRDKGEMGESGDGWMDGGRGGERSPDECHRQRVLPLGHLIIPLISTSYIGASTPATLPSFSLCTLPHILCPRQGCRRTLRPMHMY